jgi:hypothetical protein
MEHRYSLRFESGERAGESIPIRGRGFTIGRRPGNALQILDPSVSGNHAEILLDAEGPLLRDLGSTNGTRVRGDRIAEKRLAPGDRVQFGAVEMTFVGEPVASPSASGGAGATASTEPTPPYGIPAVPSAPAAKPAPATASPSTAATETVVPAAGDAIVRVSPEILARAKKRSMAGPAVLAVLVVAAAALTVYLRRSGPTAERKAKPVASSPDNLLGDDASFESESDGWKPLEGAPAVFVKSPEAKVSGATGIVADLGEGAWAVHRSREARAEAGRTLAASIQVRVEGGAVGQIGIELSPAEGPEAPGSIVAWSEPVEGKSGFAPCAVTTTVPQGYEAARVLVLARRGETKGGSVAADDASLAITNAGGSASAAPVAPVIIGDAQLSLLGGETAGVLARSGRPVVTELAFAAGDRPVDLAQATRATATVENGRISLAPAKPAAGLVLRAESGLAHAGIATTGDGGFAAHGPDFETDGATSLLLGKGNGAVRLLFASPVSLKGVAEGSASRIAARPATGALGPVAIQLDFAEDKKKAGDLAFAARNAEKKGDLGECLAKWSELLNGVPFDEALVAEADAKRASLVQQGLEELRAVRTEVDRAKFFRLPDLDRRCRDRALAVGAKYKGSEVDAEAQRIAAAIDEDLVGLDADLARAERGRLEAILAALEATNSTGLAAEVRAHLEKMPKRPGAAPAPAPANDGGDAPGDPAPDKGAADPGTPKGGQSR